MHGINGGATTRRVWEMWQAARLMKGLPSTWSWLARER